MRVVQCGICGDRHIQGCTDAGSETDQGQDGLASSSTVADELVHEEFRRAYVGGDNVVLEDAQFGHVSVDEVYNKSRISSRHGG